jgi:hypothetical protein
MFLNLSGDYHMRIHHVTPVIVPYTCPWLRLVFCGVLSVTCNTFGGIIYITHIVDQVSFTNVQFEESCSTRTSFLVKAVYAFPKSAKWRITVIV